MPSSAHDPVGPDELSRGRAVLRVDALAGLVVGVVVLLLHNTLALLYDFPSGLVLAVGAANVLYGGYSGTLLLRLRTGKAVSGRAVDFLVLANAGWALVCLGLVVSFARQATPLGVVVLALEGLFVGGLAIVERRWLRPLFP